METKDRDGSLDVVHFELDPADLRERPTEKVDAIAKALAAGRRVELSPLEQGSATSYPHLSPEALDRFLDVVGVFAGGSVLTLASLAVAPASIVVALLAGAVGGAGTAIGLWQHRKHINKDNSPQTPV